jgi:predicted kinase
MTAHGPAHHPDDPNGVLVVTGICAAGKSTVAQTLAERLPRSAHVRGDTFRRMIVNGGVPMTPEASPEAAAQLMLRHRLTAAAADAYCQAGFTAIVQDILLGEHLTATVRAIRSRPLAVVVLAPDPSAVEERERQRPKTGYDGDWTPAHLDAELRGRTPRIGLWLDTTHQSVEETADEILRRAWTEGLVP